ncbi:MAG: hypothetical protein JW982_14980 [Spirochaetes bacterium]|nr:hypothetical protein [Spirochaetota bacterium]
MANLNRKNIIWTLSVLCILVLNSFPVHPKFLVDEEFSENKADAAEKNGSETDESFFPADTAKNIQVLPVPDIINSVKITWSISPGSHDVFIVGRTTEIPSNENTALSALSIKVIQSGEITEVIDRNIPEGRYYYVILAKNKIAQKKIELYPNDNYITNPVIITKKVSDVTLLPKVDNIRATVIKEGSTAVTWTPLKLENVIYTVYRSTEPLSTPESIDKAAKAGVVKDTDSFFDSQIDKSGKYYYAVTTSDTVRNEDKQLLPDRSYTTESVNVNVEKRTTVADIKIIAADSKEIRVEWRGIPNFDGEYFIYRNESVIDSQEKLNKSYLAGKVDPVLSFYLDINPVQGANYYAVIAKDKKGIINKELIADQNYNSQPYELGTMIRIKKIQAKIEADNKIRIIWQYSGDSGNRQYRIYRAEKITDVKNEIKNFTLVANVEVSQGSYLDTIPSEGYFHYYLMPQDFELRTDIIPERGINFTADPVSSPVVKSDPYRMRSVTARKENGGAVIEWKFSGTSGSSSYSIYRSEKIISSLKVLESSYMLDDVDFTEGTYRDESVSPGKYYYAVVPSDYRKISGFKLVKGVNYTSSPVLVSADKTDVPVKPEDKSGQINSRPKTEIYIPSGLDDILKRYFYLNRYDDSIVYLKQYVINSSDERNKAVAEFYLGRCYAAKGNYREALNYFMKNNVKEHMPEDSQFWQDYCLTRMGR